MDKYIINIYEKYFDLKNSGKNTNDFDNNDLWKIFEWYSCIKLTEELEKVFYEYDDIEPEFKELHNMTKNDSGIDLCDLSNTIVQCKLRNKTLTWSDCSTFFGSQNSFSKEQNKTIIKWENLIITRNNDCKLSTNLLSKKNMFLDKVYDKEILIEYCEKLLINPPKYFNEKKKLELRDYQIDCIELIKKNKNTIINIPTGTGKNVIIISSIEENKKYLILVPRIILMEQLKEEIIKLKPNLKNKIQLIGDLNNKFNEKKNITICVYNSIKLLENKYDIFDKIYIDEAHNINIPDLYNNDIETTTNDMNYIEIIKNLKIYNNNVYLSATIDEISNFTYYKRDIREMINNKYLCDYNINIPIFENNASDQIICAYLIKNYRNIIVYCNSCEQGKKINLLLNKLLKNSSEFVDCKTPKKIRNNIIKKYKEGKISFLVNVRLLVEGFDAPNTKGVCFLHLPSSSTALIQIIGRALRLYPNKKIANIILPFSTIDDESTICKFLKIMAKNDSRIRKSYENKIFGGYIEINDCTNKDENDIDENYNLKYNLIYDSMCKLINNKEIWISKLEEVKKYIDINNKLPSSEIILDKNIHKLSVWIMDQKRNYKNNTMLFEYRDLWLNFVSDEKYKNYFIKLTHNEIWINTLNELKNYISINGKIPKYDKEKLGIWVSHQKQNYKNKDKLMAYKHIYDMWSEFVNSQEYSKYFMSNEESWIINFNNLKEYINKENKKPNIHVYINDISMGKWIKTQFSNYFKKDQIMKNQRIYNMWTKLIKSKKYSKYFSKNKQI
jgi:superfamily II DNA or RNA helicase